MSEWDWKTQPVDTLNTEKVEGDINPHKPGVVSIIMPIYLSNYSLMHYTGNALGSIKEHTDKEKTPYEIIVVDNGSPLKLKNESEYLVDKFVKNEENLGVAHAWNQGIRISSGDYICLINNDVMVFDYWLEDMKKYLDTETLDFIMATPMYGRPYARAVEAMEIRNNWLDKHQDWKLSLTIKDFRDFACVLAKKSLFEEIGVFDEQFGLGYGEDMDFFKRMDLAGKKYGSTGEVCKALVNIFHIIGSTSHESGPEFQKKMADLMNTNRELFKAKYEGGEKVDNKPAEPKVWGEDVPSVEAKPVDYTLDNLPVLTRTPQTGDKVYFIKDKKTYWVKNPEVLTALGYGFGDVVNLSWSLFSQLEIGEPITLENVETFKKA